MLTWDIIRETALETLGVLARLRLCLNQPGGPVAELVLQDLDRSQDLTIGMTWDLMEHVGGGVYRVPAMWRDEIRRAVGLVHAPYAVSAAEQLLVQVPEIQPRSRLRFRDLGTEEHYTPWCPSGKYADTEVQLGPWTALVELDDWDPDCVGLDLVLRRGGSTFWGFAPSMADLHRMLLGGVQSLTDNPRPSRDGTAYMLWPALRASLVGSLSRCADTLDRFGCSRTEVRLARCSVSHGGEQLVDGLRQLERYGVHVEDTDDTELLELSRRVARSASGRTRGCETVTGRVQALLREALNWAYEEDMRSEH